MDIHKSPFNRNLLIILVVLYLAIMTALNYTEWSASQGSTQWWMMLLNSLIMTIPLVLLFGSIYVLAVACRERTRLGQINPRLAKIIHWAPRIAAILIIFFISLFSLDVFETQATPLQLLGGFLVHNIPSIVMIVLLVFAWKRPAVGFYAFIVAGLLFAAFFVRSFYALPNLLLFVLPILLIACLFYADWKWLAPVAAAIPKDETAKP